MSDNNQYYVMVLLEGIFHVNEYIDGIINIWSGITNGNAISPEQEFC